MDLRQMWQWSSFGLVQVYKRTTLELQVCWAPRLQHRLPWVVSGWTSFTFGGKGPKKSVFQQKIVIIVPLHLLYLYTGKQLRLFLCLQTATHYKMWSSLLYHLSIYDTAFSFTSSTWSSDCSEADAGVDHKASDNFVGHWTVCLYDQLYLTNK